MCPMSDANTPSRLAGRATATRTPRTTRPGSKVATDKFFRDLVWSLRNGVLAVTRDGTVTVMNDVAYQILGLQRRPSDLGKPYTEVLKNQQEVSRIVAGAF